MAVIDLRPARGSILERFLTLGLVYDHEESDAEGNTIQIWFDYPKHLRGEFLSENATEVKFTDISTRISKVVTTEELASVTNVLTWKSTKTDTSTATE